MSNSGNRKGGQGRPEGLPDTEAHDGETPESVTPAPEDGAEARDDATPEVAGAEVAEPTAESEPAEADLADVEAPEAGTADVDAEMPTDAGAPDAEPADADLAATRAFEADDVRGGVSTSDETVPLTAATREFPAETREFPAETAAFPSETREFSAETAAFPAETAALPDETLALPDETRAFPAGATASDFPASEIPAEPYAPTGLRSAMFQETYPDTSAFAPDPYAPSSAPDLREQDRGPRVTTIVWGLILALLGGGIVVSQVTDLDVDSGVAAIGFVALAGLLLIIGAVVSAARSGRRPR